MAFSAVGPLRISSASPLPDAVADQERRQGVAFPASTQRVVDALPGQPTDDGEVVMAEHSACRCCRPDARCATAGGGAEKDVLLCQVRQGVGADRGQRRRVGDASGTGAGAGNVAARAAGAAGCGASAWPCSAWSCSIVAGCSTWSAWPGPTAEAATSAFSGAGGVAETPPPPVARLSTSAATANSPRLTPRPRARRTAVENAGSRRPCSTARRVEVGTPARSARAG